MTTYNPDQLKDGKCFNTDVPQKFTPITDEDRQSALDYFDELVSDTRDELD